MTSPDYPSTYSSYDYEAYQSPQQSGVGYVRLMPISEALAQVNAKFGMQDQSTGSSEYSAQPKLSVESKLSWISLYMAGDLEPEA